MKKKGFTLIELLVVIAIIAMLLAILMPALGRVRRLAQRLICGTNLKGLGTAQMVYANDYNDSYAVQGRRANHTLQPYTTHWAVQNPNWTVPTQISIGASLYLLVREADVGVKSFICPAAGEREFSGRNAPPNSQPLDIIDLWDFGHPSQGQNEGPEKCVSYSYQMPYRGGSGAGNASRGRFVATVAKPGSYAVMGDRNPWMDNKLTRQTAVDQNNFMNLIALLGTGSTPITDWVNIRNRWSIQVANARAHDREGQNILFADGSTRFETRPDVGMLDDNVYTRWTSATVTTEENRRQGLTISATIISSILEQATPQAEEDSVLVNDFQM